MRRTSWTELHYHSKSSTLIVCITGLLLLLISASDCQVSIVVTPTSATTYEGSSVTLKCIGNSMGPDDIIWQYYPVGDANSKSVIYFNSQANTYDGKYTVNVTEQYVNVVSYLNILTDLSDNAKIYECVCNVYTACSGSLMGVGDEANMTVNVRTTTSTTTTTTTTSTRGTSTSTTASTSTSTSTATTTPTTTSTTTSTTTAPATSTSTTSTSTTTSTTTTTTTTTTTMTTTTTTMTTTTSTTTSTTNPTPTTTTTTSTSTTSSTMPPTSPPTTTPTTTSTTTSTSTTSTPPTTTTTTSPAPTTRTSTTKNATSTTETASTSTSTSATTIATTTPTSTAASTASVSATKANSTISSNLPTTVTPSTTSTTSSTTTSTSTTRRSSTDNPVSTLATAHAADAAQNSTHPPLLANALLTNPPYITSANTSSTLVEMIVQTVAPSSIPLIVSSSASISSLQQTASSLINSSFKDEHFLFTELTLSNSLTNISESMSTIITKNNAICLQKSYNVAQYVLLMITLVILTVTSYLLIYKYQSTSSKQKIFVNIISFIILLNFIVILIFWIQPSTSSDPLYAPVIIAAIYTFSSCLCLTLIIAFIIQLCLEKKVKFIFVALILFDTVFEIVSAILNIVANSQCLNSIDEASGNTLSNLKIISSSMFLVFGVLLMLKVLFVIYQKKSEIKCLSRFKENYVSDVKSPDPNKKPGTKI